MSRPVSRARVAGAIGLLACAFHAAAAQQRETPPAPAPAKDFVLPSRHEVSLPNGMRVTLVPYGTIPLTTISLVLRTGAIDEARDQVWVSKLMGDFLLQGTTTRSAATIADAVGGMGGSLAVTAGDDETTVGGTVLGDSAPALARLLADVAQHPLFPDSEFARLRTDRLRELSIDQSEPQQLAADPYAAIIYLTIPTVARCRPTARWRTTRPPRCVASSRTRSAPRARTCSLWAGSIRRQSKPWCERVSPTGRPARRRPYIRRPHARSGPSPWSTAPAQSSRRSIWG